MLIPIIASCWLSIGLAGEWMFCQTSRLEPHPMGRLRWIWSILGPVVWVGFLTSLGEQDGRPSDPSQLTVFMRLTPRDRRNPCKNELKAAIDHLRQIQGLHGEKAKEQRKELERTVHRLRGIPKMLEVQEADAVIEAHRSEYKALETLSVLVKEAYEKAHREALGEIENLRIEPSVFSLPAAGADNEDTPSAP